ncbi:double homeobox protein 1-like [Trichechus manatus latirostris]|uniref:Double homeobox protein 1-like n=1 Tax=Trichechus manatus latirostris TaxID=127582 RepID=A0A2Y9R5X5_TRIMA|nr:double homeobox protein 1-like [Trichechus manatus latirostris]
MYPQESGTIKDEAVDFTHGEWALLDTSQWKLYNMENINHLVSTGYHLCQSDVISHSRQGEELWRDKRELIQNQSPGSQQTQARRKKTVLKPSQIDVLQASLEQNPYPGITIREELAKETGIPESQIQVWFKNHRRHLRKGPLASGRALEEEAFQGQEQPQPWSQENFPKATRRKRISITRSQTRLLVEAFEKNRFPGFAAREELAQRTGLPESRIQIWFQNRRARHPVQNTSVPVNSLADSLTQRPQVTVQLDQSNLSTVPGTSQHCPPSYPFNGNQTILPVLQQANSWVQE